ncbi:ROK family protein [Marinoscillum sp. 108]|uniref:ROK family protein n=1 Tax=Marinoscillum sp. 108 TaxID=2653151 RepID=UPI0012F3E759|nr:ROK family protein [Marinoscillum sp. 108]VXD18321.1 Glucokinase [Marinoscillum sp. 108]
MIERKSRIVMGMDVGGSHVTAALVDLDDHVFLPDSQCRLDLDSQRPADYILEDWQKVIQTCYRQYPDLERHIGMAMPGPCDYDSGVCMIKGLNKYGNLYGLNIPEALSQTLDIPDENVVMTNDAACFLQGEMAMGAARDSQSSIGVILGTGCGTARLQGGIGCDAALWQLPFKNGIAEDYLSTHWFKTRYRELGGADIGGAKDLALSYQDDPISRTVFEEFAQNLGDFLGIFVKMERADSIVLGGNIMKAGNLFLPGVKDRLASLGVNTPIHLSTLGEDAPVVGAAVAYEKKTVNHFNYQP